MKLDLIYNPVAGSFRARRLDALVRAFERRWRPNRIEGEIDGQLGGILFELLLDRDMGRAR